MKSKKLVSQILAGVVFGCFMLAAIPLVYQVIVLTNQAEDEYELGCNLVEDILRNRLETTDELYTSLEKDYNYRAMDVLENLVSDCGRNNPDDIKVKLSEYVSSDMRNVFTVLMINAENHVIGASDISYINRDMSDLSSEGLDIDTIRTGTAFVNGNTVVSDSGKITRTMYRSSLDRQYVFAVTVDYTNVAGTGWVLGIDSDFEDVASQYDFMESAGLYDENGMRYSQSTGESGIPSGEYGAFLTAVETGERVEISKGLTRTVFIPMKMSFGSSTMVVARLIFSRRDYLASIRQNVIFSAMITYFSGLIIVAVLLVALKRILHPVETLKETIISISEGNLEARADLHVNNDFDDLGRRFDTMITEYNAERIELERQLNLMREKNMFLTEQKNMLYDKLNKPEEK